jgi:hypothetical protein
MAGSTPVTNERKTNVVSEGNHIFRLTRFEEKTGPKGQYWEYAATVAEPGEEQGMPLVLRVSLTPQARWKMNEFMDAVQAPTEGVSVGEQFLGQYVRGHVIHTENSGRVRAEIDVVSALDIPPGVTLADIPVESLNPTPGGPTESPSMTPNADDEIPF